MMEAEERHVADRMEGIPLPCEGTVLRGHEHALDQLTGSYKAGRLHHALLIGGDQGIGKSSFAFTLARHILSHPNAQTAPVRFEAPTISKPVFQQVANGSHPELLHLTRPWDEKAKRFKTQLSVDEVRRTQHFYGMTAGAGGWRICIVDAADEMNAAAANALLKILEEPPKRSIFMVLSHQPGRLLPTIRSRCQSVKLNALSDSDVNAILDEFNLESKPNESQLATGLSGGSVRRAIQLIQSEVLADFRTFEQIMENPNAGSAKDWLAIHAIAQGLGRRGNDEAFHLFMDLTLSWIGRQVRAGGVQRPAALAGWAEVWDKASRSLALSDAFNLDRQQVILSLFDSLFQRQSA